MPSPKKIIEELWGERVDPLAAVAPPPVFVDRNFAAQSAFLDDPSPLKIAFCTRRAGKSYGPAGLQLFRDAWQTPGCSCLYLAKTLKSAKLILWKDVLIPINRRLGLRAKPNKTESSWTLPNSSVIYLLGADSDEDEKEKLLGQKYRRVVIDEAEAFHTDLHALVYGTLKPAVADYRGSIDLIGTPSNLKAGLFFELTKDQDASVPGTWQKMGWSCHRWSALDNPYMREKWLAEIADLERDNPRIRETPLFQQNYLGRWAIDDTKLVYRYLVGRNDYDGELPVYQRGEWHFVLAIDLGFTDACSFTVLAYHDHDRCLYVVLSYKKPGLDITDTSEEADALKERFAIEHTTIDGANKQAVEELNNRHGLEAVPADKKEKAEFIDIMNAEFIQERIKLSPSCAELKEEYGGLIWDERALEKRKRLEHPSCDNHCTDGTLYGWRHCWQYLSVALKTVAKPRTAEWYEAESKRQQDEIEAQFEEQLKANKQTEREERQADEWL